jgi:hypothetical protein
MSAEQIVEYCWWYLDHLALFLIPAAIFDIICWIAIAIYLKKRRVIGRSQGSPSADAPPHASTPTRTANGARR